MTIRDSAAKRPRPPAGRVASTANPACGSYLTAYVELCTYIARFPWFDAGTEWQSIVSFVNASTNTLFLLCPQTTDT